MPALLGMEKNAHQPARLIAEDAIARRVDLAFDELETIHRLDLLALRQVAADGQARRRLFDERHAVARACA